MRTIPIVLAGVLLATAALAQDAPPPPAPAAPAGPMAAAEPPPPPGGPRGDRPPPPPPGAAVMLDRGPNGTVRVDVHCARADTTKECADVATRLLGEASAK